MSWSAYRRNLMSRSNHNTHSDTKLTISFNEDTTEFLKLIGHKALFTSKTPLSVRKLIVSFSFGFNHLFSSKKCHKNIRLRNNKKSAKLHKKDGWSRRVHCDRTMKTGKHFIEFEINNLSQDVSIGISNSRSGVTRFVGFDRNSYSLACSGKLQHKSDADFDDPYSANWNVTPYEDDDIIAMELDLNQHTLKYYKNGNELGTAFNITDIGNKGYVFAVSMAVKGDMVSIVGDEALHIYYETIHCESNKRKLEQNDADDIISMPPPKKQKLNQDKEMNNFMEKQRASKFAKEENEAINNAFYVGQNIEIFDIASKKWVKAIVIHSENNWIVVHFDGTTSIYDQKIHTIKHKERIRAELRICDKNESDDEVPDEFCDPITFEVMVNPMLVTVSGVTYEKSVIQQYIKENGQDPMTRQKVTVEQLAPNRALRDTIEKWKKKHPGIIDD